LRSLRFGFSVARIQADEALKPRPSGDLGERLHQADLFGLV
jgi:hypothetical protein